MSLRDTLRPLTGAIRSVIGTHGLDTRLAALETALETTRQAARHEPPPAAAPALPAPPPAFDVSLLLHHSRGALLRGMPPGARRLLSAGCAGRWYFDWVDQTYGPVAEHLGIEFYSPEPADLPPHVRWIANTASDMSAVAAESCDLVFSGQNLEHLWPEEVSGFLLEAARVLRPGGHLVVDSPNRLVTAALGWSHPEHTLELTPAEMTRLLTLAGFDVTASRGIWLCLDPRTGDTLPFEPNAEAPGWSVIERLSVANADPDNSFIWWLEARRADRAPDSDAVTREMEALFAAHWPERIQRLRVPAPLSRTTDAEGTWLRCPPGYAGPVFVGPAMALRAGRYRVTWHVRSTPGAPSPVATCQVLGGHEERVLARADVPSGAPTASLEFTLSATTFNMQFPCAGNGTPALDVLHRISLAELPPG